MTSLLYEKLSVAVLGGGNCAHSLSCYLSKLGCSVHMWVRNLSHLCPCVVKEHHIEAYGKLEGDFCLYSVSSDLEESIANCQIIFVATVTTAYRDIAAKLAPYLKPAR